MSKLHYLTGDATRPQMDGKKIICHICNNIGAWGAGFVVAISKRWGRPEELYRTLNMYCGLDLGMTQLVPVEDDITVANMIAQDNINDSKNGWRGDLIDYESLDQCLDTVFTYAQDLNAVVCCPKIGSGLAGGDWSTIERLLIAKVNNYNVDCFVYIWDKK